jgi:hypothetical protein
MDDYGRLPLVVLQLGLVDAPSRYAFDLYPIVILLDLLDGNRAKLCLHSWRNACKSRVVVYAAAAGSHRVCCNKCRRREYVDTQVKRRISSEYMVLCCLTEAARVEEEQAEVEAGSCGCG